MNAEPLMLSVVIPTLDEAKVLPGLLDDLARLDIEHEVVVSDGGSCDDTVAIASAHGVRVIEGPPGRAGQLRSGAAAAKGAFLLFLHADTRFPSGANHALRDFLENAAESDFAYFGFALDGTDWFWSFIEFGQRLRERWFGLVYGDQGLVVSRALYESVGGHPDWPLFEDLGAVDLLRKSGTGTLLDAHIVTSPRRYQARGRLSQWLTNSGLVALFRLGIPPDQLVRWYPSRRQQAAGAATAAVAGSEVVVVFAKAPRLGTVKTRLARDIGDEDALRIYRTLGKRLVDELRPTGRRLVVYYTPAGPASEREVRDWLGEDGLVFAAQAEGDLGVRMARALGEGLESGGRACIVGTDIPDVSASIVDQAFARLEDHDVVIGPATDGGYYLLGLRAPCPQLFEGIPWSTDLVYDMTIARAQSAALHVARIETLTDVDTVEDVPTELLPT